MTPADGFIFAAPTLAETPIFAALLAEHADRDRHQFAAEVRADIERIAGGAW